MHKVENQVNTFNKLNKCQIQRETTEFTLSQHLKLLETKCKKYHSADGRLLSLHKVIGELFLVNM